MEYEKAAERYENLYRALWQNFSYLSLLSAAILTFGSNQLETWATVFFAGCLCAFGFSCSLFLLMRMGETSGFDCGISRIYSMTGILNPAAK
jgi:hypothetical protein